MRSAPAQLSIADVVTAAVTQEMDRMFIPANRKSRQEQHRWPARLQQLGASFGVASSLRVSGGDPLMRTKRDVALHLGDANGPG